MDVEDRTKDVVPLTEAEFLQKVVELLKLVDGLDSVHYTCSCRRLLKLGITPELRVLLPKLRAETLRRLGESLDDYLPATSRFGLCEVD